MSQRLLLIDGHSMAYRAFFALPAENFTTATGQHTNAIYGFATMLISLLRDEKPTHIAVAFDVSRKTFRTEKYPEYKANRAATPDEFRSQMSYLHELVSAFGISQFERDGFEADDILATLASHAEREGMDVVLCSGDRDCFQLVTEKITVLYPKKGVSDLARMTPDAVFEKYGMSPTSYPEFAALRGDPSDNLPSVPGVGEKTAAKWVVEYGNVSNLIANIDKIPGKVGESLRNNIDIVLRNRELTQLLHDVPLEVQIEGLAWSGVDESKIAPLFDLLEFRTLKDRIKPFTAKGSVPKNEVAEPLMMLAFDPDLELLTPQALDKKIASHTGELGITFEVVDERLHRYAVALSPTESFLVHSSQMGEWISNPRIGKVLHDAKGLARVIPVEGVVFDTALAVYVINPGVRAQELTDVVERWGDGTPIAANDSEKALIHGSMALFHLRASLTQELIDRNMLTLYLDLELPIAELLAKIERLGIAVDRKKLTELQNFFAGEVERETNATFEAVGHEFNVASPKQLQVVLFDELEVAQDEEDQNGLHDRCRFT